MKHHIDTTCLMAEIPCNNCGIKCVRRFMMDHNKQCQEAIMECEYNMDLQCDL